LAIARQMRSAVTGVRLDHQELALGRVRGGAAS
jgi:hypothetical protein